ncbi:MAG: hypothetical protein EA356_15525 [Geminicoccaceae bacterium]|nr:MAG: hypothetical protein EA356_15525 [Geminicoccaceae bacterium]
MSPVDPPSPKGRIDDDTIAADEEGASLIAQIANDPVSQRLTEFNQIVAASLVALCAASPYMASRLLQITEEQASRLAELTPLQVHELASSSSFLVVASPVLPVLVDQVLEPKIDAGPVLFAYATRRGRTDGGS